MTLRKTPKDTGTNSSIYDLNTKPSIQTALANAAQTANKKDHCCTWGGPEELLAVSDRSPQDAPEDIASAVVAGHAAVGDGEGQGARVIGNDTVGHVDAVHVVFADEAAMTLVSSSMTRTAGSRTHHLGCVRAGGRLDGAEQGRPQIRVVVAHLVLHDEDKTIETHTCQCGEYECNLSQNALQLACTLRATHQYRRGRRGGATVNDPFHG